jgi:diadenosine tetraphosphate (Ap4A) HIT family hydrolase
MKKYGDLGCPICSRIAEGDLLVVHELAVAFPDMFPVNPGHTLIVPRRHEADYFALTADEQSAIWELVKEVREILENRHHPHGYNLGINAGVAAGQTILHVHLHVMPRYAGDVPDPRGGVRWVLPQRAPYWKR